MKKLLILGLAVLCGVASAQVNLTTIPQGTTLSGNELVLMQQPPTACNNCTVTTTPAAIAAYVITQLSAADINGLFTPAANTIYAGPSSGSSGAPTFRSLVSADIPNNAANTSGSAATATTATALATSPSQCSGQLATGIAANGNANCRALVSGDIPNNAANTSGIAATASNLASTTQCSGSLATGIATNGTAQCANVIGSPTGGSLGSGTLNSVGFFVDGIPVATTNTGCTTGTFTATLLGYTTDPTTTVAYTICGYQVSLNFPVAFGYSSTSNTAYMTLTGLPASLQPNTNVTGTCGTVSSATSAQSTVAVISIGPSQGTGDVAFGIPVVTGSSVYTSYTSFISSGSSKFIYGDSSCVYPLQ